MLIIPASTKTEEEAWGYFTVECVLIREWNALAKFGGKMIKSEDSRNYDEHEPEQ
jgi:hypothetical protein